MAFDIDLSNPFTTGADGHFYGGPGQGGHSGPNWTISHGMDLGAPVGTQVRAAFGGKVTNIFTPGSPSGGIYGDQISIRQDPNSPDGIGAFYTHLKASVPVGSFVTRGEVIGEIVKFGGIPTHLHLALGERSGNVYTGVDLYDYFMATTNTEITLVVRFFQDGSPPQVIDFRSDLQLELDDFEADLESLNPGYSNTWICVDTAIVEV
ncbi:M23 family metallopeptidase [Nonomuraea sp. MCN248]|uniref:M23 family metallopeptidase n=1 Tax=Nonomuraea corallina TaxID=2989783 RepID=A0ABT4SN37_9ACTN|nr:M23 family metallopeptidase [Nonomuraea corallina]MDA0638360.1 M23 family metallopeptidase [Nonomuraea corallina]